MDRFFYLNDLQFDQEGLLACYNTNENTWAKYGKEDISSLHAKYAENNCRPILDIIRQFKDPDIIKNIKFFKTIAKGQVSPHCDSRNVAINIPIQTNKDSYTVFYEEKDDFETPEVEINGENKHTKAKRFSDIPSCGSVYLDKPICLNTDLPHGVINNSEEDRILLSISFIEEYDNFETIKNLYNKNNLLEHYDK